MKYRHLFSNRFEKPKVRGQKIKNITANGGNKKCMGFKSRNLSAYTKLIKGKTA